MRLLCDAFCAWWTQSKASGNSGGVKSLQLEHFSTLSLSVPTQDMPGRPIGYGLPARSEGIMTLKYEPGTINCNARYSYIKRIETDMRG
jgi:hypothetical protein